MGTTARGEAMERNRRARAAAGVVRRRAPAIAGDFFAWRAW